MVDSVALKELTSTSVLTTVYSVPAREGSVIISVAVVVEVISVVTDVVVPVVVDSTVVWYSVVVSIMTVVAV